MLVRRAALFLVLVATLVGGAACSKHAPRGAPPAATAPASGGDGAKVATHAALLEVRAELSLDVEDSARAESLARSLSSLAASSGGYVELSSTSDAGDGVTHVVLRVPPTQLDAVRALLSAGKKDGSSIHESVTARDVTDAIADLGARLHSARQEETRLLALLADKTGTLADVLAVEHALAGVRERIERMDADLRLAKGRVDLATVDVRLHAQPADGPLSGRLVLAARDGARIVQTGAIGLLLLLLRVGPSLAILGAIAFVVHQATQRRAPR